MVLFKVRTANPQIIEQKLRETREELVKQSIEKNVPVAIDFRKVAEDLFEVRFTYALENWIANKILKKELKNRMKNFDPKVRVD